jgi:5'-methylthioadenosine phosphorylase
MALLGVIGGGGFESLSPWAEAPRRDVESERGAVGVLEGDGYLVLARHGIDSYTPAQLVDHAGNLAALIEAGCDRVLAICSVGSLHPELGLGSFLCPDDFIALGKVDAAFDDERGHVIPAIDPVWRRLVLEAWKAAADPAIREQGVYWQSVGPRFETLAEVRLIARHADVVGMTMGSECVAACQLGLAYAAVCVVDNLANGVGGEPLSQGEYEAGHEANRERLAAAIEAVLPALLAEAE